MIVKYKVSDFAKDLNLSAKKVLDELAAMGSTGKKNSSNLEENELNYLLEKFSKDSSVTDLNEFLNSAKAPKEEPKAEKKPEKKADKKADNGQAERIIALLGGRENIVLVDACMTRLRVTVKEPAKVADLAAWKAEGALSLLVKGDGIQAVYGPKADVLKSDINDIL